MRKLRVAGTVALGWEGILVLLDWSGRIDVLKESFPEGLAFLFSPLFRDVMLLAILALWLHGILSERSLLPRLYRRSGTKYRMISYATAILIGSLVGGLVTGIIWSRESQKFVEAEADQLHPPAANIPEAKSEVAQPASVTPVTRHAGTGPDLAKMQALYVKMAELTTLRAQVYGSYIAALVQTALDMHTANNRSMFPQSQWASLDQKVQGSVAASDALQAKTFAVEQQLATLLAEIRVTFPATPEMSTLLRDVGELKPTYHPEGLTTKEMTPQGTHAWLQVQGPLATESIRNQSTYPMERLKKYMSDQIAAMHDKK